MLNSVILESLLSVPSVLSQSSRDRILANLSVHHLRHQHPPLHGQTLTSNTVGMDLEISCQSPASTNCSGQKSTLLWFSPHLSHPWPLPKMKIFALKQRNGTHFILLKIVMIRPLSALGKTPSWKLLPPTWATPEVCPSLSPSPVSTLVIFPCSSETPSMVSALPYTICVWSLTLQLVLCMTLPSLLETLWRLCSVICLINSVLPCRVIQEVESLGKPKVSWVLVGPPLLGFCCIATNLHICHFSTVLYCSAYMHFPSKLQVLNSIALRFRFIILRATHNIENGDSTNTYWVNG